MPKKAFWAAFWFTLKYLSPRLCQGRLVQLSARGGVWLFLEKIVSCAASPCLPRLLYLSSSLLLLIFSLLCLLRKKVTLFQTLDRWALNSRTALLYETSFGLVKHGAMRGQLEGFYYDWCSVKFQAYLRHFDWNRNYWVFLRDGERCYGKLVLRIYGVDQ